MAGAPDATARALATLLFAVFAYFGLLFGGDIAVNSSSKPHSFSSSSDSKLLHVSSRDGNRGLLISDRKAAPQSVWIDDATALPPVSLARIRFPSASARIAADFSHERPAAIDRGYQPRGPPALAA